MFSVWCFVMYKHGYLFSIVKDGSETGQLSRGSLVFDALFCYSRLVSPTWLMTTISVVLGLNLFFTLSLNFHIFTGLCCPLIWLLLFETVVLWRWWFIFPLAVSQHAVIMMSCSYKRWNQLTKTCLRCQSQLKWTTDPYTKDVTLWFSLCGQYQCYKHQ